MKIEKQKILVNHNNLWIEPYIFIWSFPDGGVYYTIERLGEEFYANKDNVKRINPFTGKPWR